jgi:hypothetical protein
MKDKAADMAMFKKTVYLILLQVLDSDGKVVCIHIVGDISHHSTESACDSA